MCGLLWQNHCAIWKNLKVHSCCSMYYWLMDICIIFISWLLSRMFIHLVFYGQSVKCTFKWISLDNEKNVHSSMSFHVLVLAYGFTSPCCMPRSGKAGHRVTVFVSSSKWYSHMESNFTVYNPTAMYKCYSVFISLWTLVSHPSGCEMVS